MSGRIHPILAMLVFAFCVCAIGLMLLLPPDSLNVNLVYQTF